MKKIIVFLTLTEHWSDDDGSIPASTIQTIASTESRAF